jgi:hypothetical protein
MAGAAAEKVVELHGEVLFRGGQTPEKKRLQGIALFRSANR